MSWWDDLNRVKDETIASINKAYTDTQTFVDQTIIKPLSPTRQIATTPTAQQPVAGTNTATNNGLLGVNNNMLIFGAAALIAALYFMKKH